MENQYYHISQDLKLIRVSQFSPVNNGEHVIAILKRIFHNSNTSRAGNQYDYYRYEFYNKNCEPINLKIGSAELLEVTPEHWYLNGMYQYNISAKIKDCHDVIQLLYFASSSYIELIESLLRALHRISIGVMIDGSGRAGFEGYWMYYGINDLIDKGLRNKIITADQMWALYKLIR